MKPAVLEGKLKPIGTEPVEDAVVIALQQPDGTYVYTSTANNGFWCGADGTIGAWGDTSPVYVEFNGLVLTYGHRKGVSKAGEKYTFKPTFIYTKNNVHYKATLVLDLIF